MSRHDGRAALHRGDAVMGMALVGGAAVSLVGNLVIAARPGGRHPCVGGGCSECGLMADAVNPAGNIGVGAGRPSCSASWSLRSRPARTTIWHASFHVGPVFFGLAFSLLPIATYPQRKEAGPIYNKRRVPSQNATWAAERAGRYVLGASAWTAVIIAHAASGKVHAVERHPATCGAREHAHRPCSPRGVQGCERDRIVADHRSRDKAEPASAAAAAGAASSRRHRAARREPTMPLAHNPHGRTCRRLGVTVRTTLTLVAGHLFRRAGGHQGTARPPAPCLVHHHAEVRIECSQSSRPRS